MPAFNGRCDIHIIGAYLKPLSYGTWHLQAYQDGRHEPIRTKSGDVSSFVYNTPQQAELLALSMALKIVRGGDFPIRLYTTDGAIADWFDTLDPEFPDGLSAAMADRLAIDLARFPDRLAALRNREEMMHIIEMLQGASK